MLYVFGEFELDTQRYEFRQAGVPQPLEPQGFNVLAYLLEQRERVVSKGELLERLWPNQYVTEATLTQRLVAVRRALGDDGRTQRYIRTVHGRGYRFVAEVVAQAVPAPTSPPLLAEPPTVPLEASTRRSLCVGRDAELAILHERFARALQGERQMVFVSGEAGMGKTTLVDTFVAQVQASTAVWVGRGQCIEHYGAGEAYLPLLEALGRLGRSPEGEPLVTALRQQAPGWLVHLPGLGAADGAAPQAYQQAGLTRERMMRELADALESLTATQPLLLVLEDLHWSDVSTVDWLSYIARRRDPARLLILGTYRSSEALARQHPLPLAVQEVQRQGQAVQLPLPYWSMVEVMAYLGQRFGALPYAAEVVHLLHHRTKGQPFFLVAMVEAMAPQDLLQGQGSGVQALSGAVPQSIRRLIECQLEALPAPDQALLEAASVAGEAFTSAVLAASLDQTVEAVETSCEVLARQGQFIDALGLETWPDGTVAMRYGFRHALYHEVLYARLAPRRRLYLHHQLGLLKERAYGAQVRHVAAELAMHFARSQDTRRCLTYLHMAAQNALQRCAYEAGIASLLQGLELLHTVPEAPTRQQHELLFQATLGMAYAEAKGYAAPEVGQAYTRAYELCQQVGEARQMFAVLLGLRTFHLVHGACQTARSLGEQLVALAQQTGEPMLQLRAYGALGEACFHLGHLAQARRHLEQGLTSSSLPQPQTRAIRPLTVVPMGYLAWTLWHQGYAEQAMQRCAAARALAQDWHHPLSLAIISSYTAMLYQFRGEAQAAETWSTAAITLALEYGFPFWEACGMLIWGWAQVVQGRQEAGLERMHAGLRRFQSTTAVLNMPSWLALFAEAYSHTGHIEAGHQAIDSALSILQRTDERYHEPELYRLKGVLYLQQPLPELTQAVTCLQQALTLARQRGARAWELRAALSLGRLWHQQGQGREARQLVGEAADWFTEGFDSVDLQQARTFLEATR